MKREPIYEAIIAIAVALAFVMPVAAFEGSINNSEMTSEIDSASLCPSLCYNAEDTDIAPDASNLGVLGDRFYAYRAYPNPEGPVYFDSEDPGNITFIKETTSSDFIAGGTWAGDTWYGCQFNNGWLWTIDEVTGNMTLIGGGGTGLNGLAYDLITDKMYEASSYNLYTVNMSTGEQTSVGPFNTGGIMIGIAFNGEGTLYGVDLGTDCLYSIDPLTGAAELIGPLGININFAQDMAYDITWNVLYLATYNGTYLSGQLYTCNVTTGACTLVGKFQGGAEITGFAIPYTPSLPPETPQRPDGPTEGVVGVEYMFSTRTTDPEENQVYYLWDWDDETPSEWLGPYNSGDTVLACHTWMGAETYNVRVKAKDIYNRKSEWSDPKTIHIVDAPILEIGNISGLFKVTAQIKNSGSNATGVDWSINLDGGIIILGKETSGKILSIPVGEEKTISSSLILGFGKTVVTVEVWLPDGLLATKQQNGFVLLFFIKI